MFPSTGPKGRQSARFPKQTFSLRTAVHRSPCLEPALRTLKVTWVVSDAVTSARWRTLPESSYVFMSAVKMLKKGEHVLLSADWCWQGQRAFSVDLSEIILSPSVTRFRRPAVVAEHHVSCSVCPLTCDPSNATDCMKLNKEATSVFVIKPELHHLE